MSNLCFHTLILEDKHCLPVGVPMQEEGKRKCIF